MSGKKKDSINLKNRFGGLKTYYLVALGIIAVSVVLGQFFIQRHLSEQKTDAYIINTAGRQRMLVQRIVRMILELDRSPDSAGRLITIKQLQSTQQEWTRVQQVLTHQNGIFGSYTNSDETAQALLAASAPHVDGISNATIAIVNLFATGSPVQQGRLQSLIDEILVHERPLLQHMEQLVLRFEQRAEQKVTRLKRLEFLLLGVVLTIILLEITILFIPTARRINDTLLKLIKSEDEAQRMSREIGALYASLEASYEKISAITLPVAPPSRIATADRGGNIIEITEQYRQEFPVRAENACTAAQLFALGAQESDEFMDNVIDQVSEGGSWQQEFVLTDTTGEKRYLDVHVVPVFGQLGNIRELHILAADLTRRRVAEQDIYRKDKAEIDRKINEQQFRSVLVLEGQEEERKRIAMNIHDGIGQLLTSLKFHLASIDLTAPVEAQRKIEDINHLVREVIQEVRRVTFNLKPPVLSDYGLAAGLKNLVKEIDRMSTTAVTFENSTGFNQRLPSKTENNVYRIVQEALNNAIKYAQSDRIEVVLQHDATRLTVVIKDYGNGFDMETVDVFHTDFGHGFLNMRERTAYIDGTLQIESSRGVGTIVKLFVPLVQR